MSEISNKTLNETNSSYDKLNFLRQLNVSFSIMFEDKIEGYKTETIGQTSQFGFSNQDLFNLKQSFPDNTELINLKEMLPPILHEFPDVYILVLKNHFGDLSNDLLNVCVNPENSSNNEITGICWDKFKVRTNKNCDKLLVQMKDKYRLIFNDLQDGYKKNFQPEYQTSTIYNYQRIPSLNQIKQYLDRVFNFNSVIEGYCYYDINESFTPFHRDRDRRKLLLLRLGKSLPVNFRWYHGTIHCSAIFSLNLNHGDLLIMSDSVNGFGKDGTTKLYLKYSEGLHKNSLK